MTGASACRERRERALELLSEVYLATALAASTLGLVGLVVVGAVVAARSVRR